MLTYDDLPDPMLSHRTTFVRKISIVELLSRQDTARSSQWNISKTKWKSIFHDKEICPDILGGKVNIDLRDPDKTLADAKNWYHQGEIYWSQIIRLKFRNSTGNIIYSALQPWSSKVCIICQENGKIKVFLAKEWFYRRDFYRRTLLNELRQALR